MVTPKMLHVLVADRNAGTLYCDPDGKLGFVYRPDYEGPDLSVSMPVEGREFWGRRVHAWFAGLLPDSLDVRRGMAAIAECGPNSVFGLLRVFGLDLPGAVQVLSEDSLDLLERESGYAEATPAQVRARLEKIAGAERRNAASRWMEPGERWSLGGNQGKIALRAFDGKWYTCLGNAASNVIVKPGVSWLDSQALDECVCMRLAKRVGLPTANVSLHSFDGYEAIVIERYDRVTLEGGSVFRIHQEDFCQALGVVPEKKYAADGGPTSAAAINLVDGDSTGRGKKLFFDALVFNYLLAATDAHAKNYSLLHTTKGLYRMAPLYDIASIMPYMKKGTVYRLAMSIGGENRVGWLRKASLAKFSSMHGLDQELLENRVDVLAERVMANIETTIDEFASCEGIDQLASLLIPRVRGLCQAAQRNVRVGSDRFKPFDASRLNPNVPRG